MSNLKSVLAKRALDFPPFNMSNPPMTPEKEEQAI